MKLIKDLKNKIDKAKKAGKSYDNIISISIDRSIREDSGASNVFADFDENDTPELDIMNYYHACHMKMIAYLCAMPNTAAYKLFTDNEKADNYHKEKFVVDVQFIANDTSGIDLGQWVNPSQPRISAEMELMWWGGEDELKYIVSVINKDYKVEIDRRLAYLEIIKNLAADKNVCPKTATKRAKPLKKKIVKEVVIKE
jgi:hypothetical protein